MSAPPKKVVACKAFRCEYIDTYDNMVLHQEAIHPELTLDEVLDGVESKAKNPAPKLPPIEDPVQRPLKSEVLKELITKHDIESAK